MKLRLEKLKYSIDDIVQISGESRSNVSKAIKLGHIPVFVVGKRKCALPADVQKWIAFLKRESDEGRPVKYQARATA